MGILLSSGCIHNKKTGCNIQLLRECMMRLPISGIELMIMRRWYDDLSRINEELLKLDIPIPIVHIEKSVGEKLSRGDNDAAIQAFERNTTIARSVNAKKVVLHLWHGPGSDRNLQNNILQLSKLRTIAINAGVELLVENIPCENVDEIGLLIEISTQYPEQEFVFDTKNAAFCDNIHENKLQYLFSETLISHIHLNDYCGEPRKWENVRNYKLPGDGDIDFNMIFRKLNSNSYQGQFTIEAPITNHEGEIDYSKIHDKVEQIGKSIAAELFTT